MPAQLETTAACRPLGHSWREGGEGDTPEGILLPQGPQVAGGEQEEDACGEAPLVSLLCSAYSSPNKTHGKSKLFLPAFAFLHKLALLILLPALICCEETGRPPCHMLSMLLRFFTNAGGFAASLLLLTAGHLSRTDGFHTQLVPLLPPPHSPLLPLVCSLLPSFTVPLSDPVPMEILRHKRCRSSLCSHAGRALAG